MREILFRGKTEQGEWIEGLLTYCNFNHGIEKAIYVATELGSIIPYRTKQETVGQYTGLTDKNGKKIFEGDIVCTRFPKECEHAGNICSLGDIQFRDGMFGIEWTQWKNDTFWGLRRIDEDFHKEIEIIGNIYDNPELLEVGV